VPLIAGVYLVSGPSLFWLAASAGGLMSYEVHRWAHAPRLAPRWAVVLQEIGLFQSPKDHAAHHRPPQDRAYCILTAWLNPVLDAAGVWRRLERLTGRSA
jgi:ubiquitin-conjugating enzyme E2 variant